MSETAGDAVLTWGGEADDRARDDRRIPEWKWCQSCGMYERIEVFGDSRNEPDSLARSCKAAKNRVGAESSARHKAGHGVRGKS